MSLTKANSTGPVCGLHAPRSIRASILAAAVVSGISACSGGGGGSAGSGGPTIIAAALPEGEHITFSAISMSLSEADRRGSLQVVRTGSGRGAVSVKFRFNDVTATADADYSAEEGELSWADGDMSERTISLLVLSDLDTEVTESLSVELYDIDGAETLGANGTVSVDIQDSACSGRVPADISVDTSLTAACYLLDSVVTVAADAQLSIAAGTSIFAQAGTGLKISGQASIDAAGTIELPVLIQGANAGAGYWQGITLTSSNAQQRFSYTTIADTETAVEIVNGSGLDLFANNSIARSSVAALGLPLDLAGQLGSETEIIDSPGGVRIFSKTVTANNAVVLPALTTHYMINENLNVDGPLTLEAGAELRFAQNVHVYISSNGSLNAVGTESSPIIMRGQVEQAGYWVGIRWFNSSSQKNRLEHITVSHGGGWPAEPGNLNVTGVETHLTVKDSTLTDSLGYGFYQKGEIDNVVLDNVSFNANQVGDTFGR